MFFKTPSPRITVSLLFRSLVFGLLVSACSPSLDQQQTIENAHRYAEQGQLVSAALELRNLLQQYPDNAEARYLLGEINLQAGDLAGAEKEFRRALQAGWDEQQVKLGLARIYVARQEYRKLLKEISPDEAWQAQARADSTALRALAEAGLGKPEQARQTLRQGKQFSEDSPQLLRTLAMFQMAGIESGDASATLQRALQLYPDDTELLLLAASHELLTKQYGPAERHYRKVISQEPDKLITANSRRARLGLARLLIMQQQRNEAQNVLDPVLRTIENDPEANFLSALLAFSQDRLDRAEEHIRVLLELAPDHARSHQLMGKIKFALKDYQQASLHLTRYLGSQPDDVASRKLLARTYLLISRPELAKQTLQPLLAEHSGDRDTRVLLSQIELALGNNQVGISTIEAAVRNKPGDLGLLQQLAQAYIHAGKRDKALRALQDYEQRGGDATTAEKLRISAHLGSGDTEQALQHARALLDANPDSAELQTLVGDIYAHRGELTAARQHYQQALQQQPGHPAAVTGLAALDVKAGKPDDAEQHYLSLVERQQHTADTLVALAQLAARRGDTKAMLKWLQQARDLDSGNLTSRLVLARYSLKQGDYTTAGLHTREALQIAPANADALLLEGKRLIALKNTEQAIEVLKKLNASAPQSPTAQISLAEAYLRSGELKKARKLLSSVLKKQADNPLAISLMADLELLAGKPDASLQHARRLQRLKNTSASGFIQEGKAWLRQNQPARAIKAFEQAWQRQPGAELLLQRHRAHRRAGQNDKAMQLLEHWLSQHPDDQAIRFVLASSLQQAGNNTAAIEQFEILLQQQPDNGAVLNNLAWLYSMQDDPKAIDLAERAYRLLPDDPGVLDTYGWILSRQGNAQKGLRLIRQALQQLPDNPDIQYHEAMALANTGQTAEARRALQKLLNKHPRFSSREAARQLLQSLN